MVVVFFSLSSGSKEELAPLGSRHAAMPMPASSPEARRRSRSLFHRGEIDMREHLVDHGVIVAAVIGAAARDQIGKLFLADEIAAAHLDAIETEGGGDLVDRGLDRIIGRRLAEAAHGFLHRLVGRHRLRAVLHALDLVRTDDGADRLAQLERRAAGIGAGIVQRADLHRLDDAVIVEGDIDVEDALGAVGVAAAHIVEPVLDQPHRPAEPPRQMRHQHGLLDAALDAVAAADIDVLMHAHAVGGNSQRARDLVGIFRHLDRGPDVEHVAPGIPGRHDAEGLDRNGGTAAPGDAERQMPRALGEMLFDLAPHEGAVEQHVGAVRGMHRRAVRLQRLFRVDHEGQRLIVDDDFFGGVLGQRAAVGDHGHHPFAGIARLPDRERMALDHGRIEPVHQRIGRGREFVAGQHIMHARHRQRRRGIDRDDARGRMLRGQHRHMQHALERDVGDVMAVARDETAILANPAIGRDEAEGCGIGVHFASTADVPAGAAGRGVLARRSRSAANCTASTIWP